MRQKFIAITICLTIIAATATPLAVVRAQDSSSTDLFGIKTRLQSLVAQTNTLMNAFKTNANSFSNNSNINNVNGMENRIKGDIGIGGGIGGGQFFSNGGNNSNNQKVGKNLGKHFYGTISNLDTDANSFTLTQSTHQLPSVPSDVLSNRPLINIENHLMTTPSNPGPIIFIGYTGAVTANDNAALTIDSYKVTPATNLRIVTNSGKPLTISNIAINDVVTFIGQFVNGSTTDVTALLIRDTTQQ